MNPAEIKRENFVNTITYSLLSKVMGVLSGSAGYKSQDGKVTITLRFQGGNSKNFENTCDQYACKDAYLYLEKNHLDGLQVALGQ